MARRWPRPCSWGWPALVVAELARCGLVCCSRSVRRYCLSRPCGHPATGADELRPNWVEFSAPGRVGPLAAEKIGGTFGYHHPAVMSSQAFRSGGRPIPLLKGALGAALLIASLHAGAASALSFNFTFSGTGIPTNPATVTGIVDGLIDNTNDQKTGLTLTITSATNAPPGGWPVFAGANYSQGAGFDVSGGQVTGVNVLYVNGASSLRLGNQSLFRTELLNGSSFDINESRNDPGNSLLFTTPTQASVPGPLPLFGAGAAFGWSRRLRRRIKTSA